MFAANSFSFDLKESVILPRRPFLLWKGFFEDGDWELSLQASQKENESGWVQVQSKNWTLITRQLCGSYPQWRGPIPSPDQKKCAVSFTQEAIETVLATIPKLPGREEKNQPVTLRFDGGDGFALETRSIGQDSPLSVPVTGVSIQGQPDTVQLNRTFLLKAFKLGLSELELFGPSVPLIFRAGGRRLIVQPLSPPPDESILQINQPSASQANSSSPEMPDQIQEETPKMKNTNRGEQIDNTAETNSGNAAKEPTVFMQAMDQVEKIKETLKSVVTDLQTLSKLLTHAQREKKTTEKEIESIRDTLQSLQRNKI
jgi:hypothetical protein